MYEAFTLCVYLVWIHIVMYRNQLLIHEENSNPDLQMLLKVIDLLASCAEGENLFIESICQNVIGISELLQVVINIGYVVGYCD